MEKKRGGVEVKIRLHPSLHSVLLSQKSRTGRSISSLVEEAVRNYLYHSELQMEIRRAAEIMKLVSQELENVQEALSELVVFRKTLNETNRTLRELLKWNRVSAFWGALLVELFKMKLFQTRRLSNEEFDLFKTAWHAAHEYADERIFSLTKEKVWRQGFDPKKEPGKGS